MTHIKQTEYTTGKFGQVLGFELSSRTTATLTIMLQDKGGSDWPDLKKITSLQTNIFKETGYAITTKVNGQTCTGEEEINNEVCEVTLSAAQSEIKSHEALKSFLRKLDGKRFNLSSVEIKNRHKNKKGGILQLEKKVDAKYNDLTNSRII